MILLDYCDGTFVCVWVDGHIQVILQVWPFFKVAEIWLAISVHSSIVQHWCATSVGVILILRLKRY